MSETRYSRDHEYVRIEGDVAVIGITNFAQEQLGDVVFVELPPIGKVVARGAEIAVVESVKAASEVYAPIAGEVLEVNGKLEESPMLVNEDAEGAAWFLKLRITDPAELADLLTLDDYRLTTAR